MALQNRSPSRKQTAHLALTALLVLEAIPLTCDATHGALKNTEWKPVCELATELAKVPKLSIHKVQQMVNSATTSDKLAARLQLYATKNWQAPNAFTIRAIAIALKKKAANLNSELVTAVQLSIQRSKTTATLRGQILETMKVLGTVGNDGTTAFCLGDATAANSEHTKLKQAGCHTESWDVGNSPDAPTTTVISDTGFPNLAKTIGDLGSSHGNTKCGYFTAGADHQTARITGSTVPLLAGLWTVTSTETVTPTAATNLKGDGTRNSNDLVKAAHFDAVAARMLDTSSYTTDELQLIKKAAAKETLKPILSEMLMLTKKKTATTEAAREAERLIEANVPQTGNKIQELWNAIKTEKVIGEAKDSKEATEINNLADSATIHQNIVFYQNKITTDLLETEAENVQLKKANKITTKTPKRFAIPLGTPMKLDVAKQQDVILCLRIVKAKSVP
uniref:Variant surface glycoprotein 1248 n=1 Tax=Trypanosoma brucei TaxID=5691 RepID=M4SUY0_9TRYP|nr:variant surface glycoprotein 1248 [Trypanosoma brucei]